MLYVVNMSFTEEDMDAGMGTFSCLVEAGSTEKALETLRTLLASMKDKEAFEKAQDFYVDSIVKVKRIPPTGLIANWRWVRAESGIASHALPSEHYEDCEVVRPKARDTGRPFFTFAH